MDDARTDEKKSPHRSSRAGGYRRWFVRAGIRLLAVTVLSVMNVGITPADDQPLPSMTVGYQNGRITAIYENTLDIGGRTYGLMPDVVVLDPEGNPMELSDIRPNCEVKFHLKKTQQGDVIDKIIAYLPQ